MILNNDVFYPEPIFTYLMKKCLLSKKMNSFQLVEATSVDLRVAFWWEGISLSEIRKPFVRAHCIFSDAFSITGPIKKKGGAGREGKKDRGWEGNIKEIKPTYLQNQEWRFLWSFQLWNNCQRWLKLNLHSHFKEKLQHSRSFWGAV